MPDVAAGRTLVEIPHDRVRPDPDQPRTEWAEEDLDDLQGKVEPAGRLLQPITVREDPDKPGYFVIKTGREMACNGARQAGLGNDHMHYRIL
ncbi:ParB N-terminal domain-containing protein [Aeromonas hydrophila]|uniref:ParB N-terminal domain-containing protein n=1 Tax=Aeromonas hydrophila TaxID=644 RepID=A0A926IYC0_AERHY|nr:ParB N-terminal domain-containing protein [Aeromonas hydrophila]